MAREPGDNQENQGSQPTAGGFRKTEEPGWPGLQGVPVRWKRGRAQEVTVTGHLAARAGNGSQIQRQHPPTGHKEVAMWHFEGSARTVISIK